MDRRSRSLALSLLCASTLLGACSSDDADALTNAGRRAGGGDDVGDAAPPEPEHPDAAFTYGAELSLLPFDVRMEKVARVAGVATDDPILDVMHARRLELGDHDYAKGQKPDLTWSSSRIGTWIRAIKPVCASTQMKALYPSFPGSLDALYLAAYGRHVTDEDRSILQQTVGASALDSDTQYRLTCLMVLASVEFVAR